MSAGIVSRWVHCARTDIVDATELIIKDASGKRLRLDTSDPEQGVQILDGSGRVVARLHRAEDAVVLELVTATRPPKLSSN